MSSGADTAHDNHPQPANPHLSRIDLQITVPVLGLLILLVVLCAVDIGMAQDLLTGLQRGIVRYFAWLFSSSVTLLLVFALWLAFSRFSHVRIGGQDAVPEFSRPAWLAMLFSAGMGIGLVFFGVAEPVLHFLAPPHGVEAESVAAARQSMRLSLFHWGLHAWGIYVVLGLALAYFHFSKNQPLVLRSTLIPLLGRRTHGLPGKLIDSVAVLGTLFGLATSLGLGAAQINAGLEALYGVQVRVSVQVSIICIITVLAITSLVMGLHKGIRRLSEFNMLLAALLLLFVLLVGPTFTLLRGLPDHLGNYLQNLPGLSLRTDPFTTLEWQQSWTLFYWAWWLSWAPFVGTFIARISRGRSVREFVLWVLLMPTLLSLVWFGIFGGAALNVSLQETALGDAVQSNSATAIYALLEHYPLTGLTSFIAIVLVAVFFVTSSDSGSFVVDMLTSGGHPDPSRWQRIFWASMEGLLAIVLLLIGGLSALQAGAISLGLPVCVLMLGVMIALYRQLNHDHPPHPPQA